MYKYSKKKASGDNDKRVFNIGIVKAHGHALHISKVSKILKAPNFDYEVCAPLCFW